MKSEDSSAGRPFRVEAAARLVSRVRAVAAIRSRWPRGRAPGERRGVSTRTTGPHPVSWALWDVLQTADEAEHVLAADLGLSYTDTRALSHVMTDAPLGPVELGRRLGISSASATVLTDRLVASGHLSRQPHPDDARRKTLAATPYGRTSAVSALAPLLNALDRAVDNLSDRDVSTIASYLYRVAEVQRAYSSSRSAARDGPSR